MLVLIQSEREFDNLSTDIGKSRLEYKIIEFVQQFCVYILESEILTLSNLNGEWFFYSLGQTPSVTGF